jgi:hypothetical protein
MDKKQQFITEVQTGVIIRCIMDKSEPGKGAMYSALVHMDSAFLVADQIPKDMTANEAAVIFLAFRFDDSKEPGYKMPDWLAIKV